MSGPEWYRPLLAIGAVLALVAVLAWVARRGGLAASGRRQIIRVESALPLGERRSVAIIAVEGRRLLVGLGAAQVTLLTELAPGDFQHTLADKRPGGPA